MKRWTVLLVLVAAAASLAAREKITVKSLLAKSDAVYYTPALHGLTDLAVDIAVEQLATDPVGKDAVVTYYYAGEDRQRMAVTGIPESQAVFRTALLDLLTPLSQYVVPRSATASFAGMTVKLSTVMRQLRGVKPSTFYLLTGTVAGEAKTGQLKEYRVLVGKDGLVRQIENVFVGSTITADVENVPTPDGSAWLFTALYTRMSVKEGDQTRDLWKSERMTYENIDGFLLPVKCIVQFRDMYNRPVTGREDLVITLKNYRLNTGLAAKTLAGMEQPKP